MFLYSLLPIPRDFAVIAYSRTLHFFTHYNTNIHFLISVHHRDLEFEERRIFFLSNLLTLKKLFSFGLDIIGWNIYPVSYIIWEQFYQTSTLMKSCSEDFIMVTRAKKRFLPILLHRHAKQRRTYLTIFWRQNYIIILILWGRKFICVHVSYSFMPLYIEPDDSSDLPFIPGISKIPEKNRDSLRQSRG